MDLLAFTGEAIIAAASGTLTVIGWARSRINRLEDRIHELELHGAENVAKQLAAHEQQDNQRFAELAESLKPLAVVANDVKWIKENYQSLTKRLDDFMRPIRSPRRTK